VTNGQDDDKFIHTIEGNVLGSKKQLVFDCKVSYKAPADNEIIKQICDCQVNLLDWRYSNKQVRDFNKKYKGKAFSKLIESDSLFEKQRKECTSDSKKLSLFSIPDYKKSFIDKCVQDLILREKPINDTLATLFCSCAANVLESRKIPLEKLEDMSDPSSFLYNEVAFKCGSPYLKPSDFAKDWQFSDSIDITGPSVVDSVKVISLMGIHKVKITIGKETRIWMLDTGASDLLISDDFLILLKKQGAITEMNYVGEGRYSLADGSSITCKRYKIDNVLIGRFIINNVILASSKGTTDFLVGKSLLNKFSQWVLDNKNNLLILKK
jgi:hypothetical protein